MKELWFIVFLSELTTPNQMSDIRMLPTPLFQYSYFYSLIMSLNRHIELQRLNIIHQQLEASYVDAVNNAFRQLCDIVCEL